jgi:pilus assembly protein Flp/PilA
MEKIWRFIKDEGGLETPEYAVMGALIILGVIAAVTLLRNQISATFNTIANAMSGTVTK